MGLEPELMTPGLEADWTPEAEPLLTRLRLVFGHDIR